MFAGREMNPNETFVSSGEETFTGRMLMMRAMIGDADGDETRL